MVYIPYTTTWGAAGAEVTSKKNAAKPIIKIAATRESLHMASYNVKIKATCCKISVNLHPQRKFTDMTRMLPGQTTHEVGSVASPLRMARLPVMYPDPDYCGTLATYWPNIRQRHLQGYHCSNVQQPFAAAAGAEVTSKKNAAKPIIKIAATCESLHIASYNAKIEATCCKISVNLHPQRKFTDMTRMLPGQTTHEVGIVASPLPMARFPVMYPDPDYYGTLTTYGPNISQRHLQGHIELPEGVAEFVSPYRDYSKEVKWKEL
ncbi:hypothetical protein Tco_0091687 [Tanacetum coccineum]